MTSSWESEHSIVKTHMCRPMLRVRSHALFFAVYLCTINSGLLALVINDVFPPVH